MSKRFYTSLLNRHFASLVSNESGAVLGNFAAIDLKEGQASFAGTTVFSGGAVLATRLSGGSADGLIPILRGSEFNAGVGAGAQLHLLNRGRLIRDTTSLSWDRASCIRYQDAVARIQRDYASRRIEADSNYALVTRRLQLIQLGRRAAEMRRVRDSLVNVSQHVGAADSVVKLRGDSLSVELAKVMRDSALRAAEPLPSIGEQQLSAHNARARQLKLAEDSLDVTGFSVGWISFEYRVDNVAFRLFDPNSVIASQVEKRSFATHSAGLRYSQYHFSQAPFETRFWSVSALVSRGHNLGELSKSEITDRSTFESGATERVSEKKYTVYTGEYRRGLTTLMVAGDYYQFVFNRNQGAVHMYPAVILQDGGPTVYNFGLGFLITARKSSSVASVLNAELFYDLTDLTNARESEENLLGRSGVGLRLSFPITFRPEI